MFAGGGSNLADKIRAFNGETADAVRTRAAPGGALAAAVEYARREPGKVLASVLALHLLLWTVLPILVCPNLQLDLVDDLALGKEWQLGYWKHPPLPWWAAELAYRLTGQIDSVYVLGPLAAVICLYAVWLLAREMLGGFAGLIAVLALEGVHYYNFSVVKFAHDQMQLPFWAFTGLFFYRALKRGRMSDWFLAGACLAGAFWSKYAAFVLAGTLGLLLLADPVARRAWRTPGPYLMAVAFALVIAPNAWWLIGHDFLPFQYVDERAKVAIHWYQYLTFPLQWIASQALNLLPAAGLMTLLYPGAKAGERDLSSAAAFDRRYITWLALGPFLLTTLIGAALGRLVIPMWGYPLWSFAPVAVLLWFKPTADPRALRRFAAAFIAIFVAVPVIYAVVEIGEPFVRDRPKATQFPGKILADVLTRAWHEHYGTPLLYVGGTEFAANNVAVYSPDQPHVVVHGDLKLSPWIDKAKLRRHGAVLVWEEGFIGSYSAEIKATFGSDIDVQPPLFLARQAWHRVRPRLIIYALVPPQP
jgi:4-amino-4-deoxy-L-arabinose transferase-like glycosyltransferase